MKLSNTNVMQLAQAIRWFDGVTKPVFDADKKMVGQDTVIPAVPWEVTYALGRNAKALASQAEVIESTRKAILTKANGGKLGDIGPDHKNHKQVLADLEKLMAAEAEVSLHQFEPELLKACSPSIPPTVLQYLLPLFPTAKP